jgi:hypothetical protein
MDRDDSRSSRRQASVDAMVQHDCRRSRRLTRVNDAPTPQRILLRSGTADAASFAILHHFKTTVRIAPPR